MTRTHKPSAWQPAFWQFDQAIYDDVLACYPPDIMSGIVAAARIENVQPDAGKRAELAKMIEHNIINLGVWTKNWLTLARRPTPAQRATALNKVKNAAKRLEEALEKLDGDSSDDLRRVMLSDEFSQYAIGIDPNWEMLSPLRGYAKYQTMIDITGKIEEWATSAQANTAEPKEGNRRADIKRGYAEGIIDIWLKIGYEKPTVTIDPYESGRARGPLMEFTDAAARPLGLTPMVAALRQAIALSKKRGDK